MSILKVARMGHPVLREQGPPLDRGRDQPLRSIQKLIDDMIDTMVEYHGVGLAAPQVHEGVRLFVAVARHRRRRSDAKVEPIAIINPEIHARSAARSSRTGRAA